MNRSRECVEAALLAVGIAIVVGGAIAIVLWGCPATGPAVGWCVIATIGTAVVVTGIFIFLFFAALNRCLKR